MSTKTKPPPTFAKPEWDHLRRIADRKVLRHTTDVRVCVGCNHTYTVRYGDDDEGVCHDCAYAAVDALARLMAIAEGRGR
jgi:hypothetical protein